MSQFVGRVVGTKMQKTAKVEVLRMFLHPQVLKVQFPHPQMNFNTIYIHLQIFSSTVLLPSN